MAVSGERDTGRGVPLEQMPDQHQVDEAVTRAFPRRAFRIVEVLVVADIATIVVKTDHGAGKVTAAELVELATQLDVPLRSVQVWDTGRNRLEVSVDLGPVTDRITLPRKPER